jgi:NAD(P)-dependent dehydrogenase (short-subunit alcohol dehydrogenase family)
VAAVPSSSVGPLGDEIANAVVFLTSSGADYINGAILVGGVDGVDTFRWIRTSARVVPRALAL